MIIDNYLEYIQEGYILDDKSISIDLDKFENGESNKLIIVGLSGGGKTTLGKYLAEKYNCYYNELDNCCRKSLTKEELDEYRKDMKTAIKPKFFKIFNDKCFKPALLSNRREVLEGPIYQSYNMFPTTRPLVNKHPVIILGTSALKSSWNRIIRTSKKHKERTSYEHFKKVIMSIELNFGYLQNQVDMFKKERLKAGGEVKVFKVPKI
jgi:ABC-type oligopeptide transport system ATPase subunit